MSKQLDTLARIALAGAIADTYESRIASTPSKEISVLLARLKHATERTFELYDRVTMRGIQRIDRKIEAMKNKTWLGKPRSIVTLIDFSLAVIDEPARKSKDDRRDAIQNIAGILLAFRREIAGDSEYQLSFAAAARAADIWDEVQI